MRASRGDIARWLRGAKPGPTTCASPRSSGCLAAPSRTTGCSTSKSKAEPWQGTHGFVLRTDAPVRRFREPHPRAGVRRAERGARRGRDRARACVSVLRPDVIGRVFLHHAAHPRHRRRPPPDARAAARSRWRQRSPSRSAPISRASTRSGRRAPSLPPCRRPPPITRSPPSRNIVLTGQSRGSIPRPRMGVALVRDARAQAVGRYLDSSRLPHRQLSRRRRTA